MALDLNLDQLFTWSLVAASLTSLALLWPGSLLRFSRRSGGRLPLGGLILFAAAFGAAGSLRPIADLPSGARLCWAAVTATLCTAALSWLVRRYFQGAGAAEVAGTPLCGSIAEVTVSLPDGGVGQIAFSVNGSRVTMPARSTSGAAVPRSTLVVIVDTAGRVARVEELGL